MRRKSTLILIVSLLLFAASARAEVRSIPLAAPDSRLEAVHADESAICFRVEVGQLTAMTVDTKAGRFTRLVVPGFHATKQVGQPELPLMNRLIAIPQGATVRIEIEAVQSRMIDLREHGIAAQIMPAQPSMPKSADPDSWPFIHDKSAYLVEKASRELVSLTPLGHLRAMQLGRLEVSPVEYYPQTNRIRVAERIDFRIVFDGADRIAQQELSERTCSPFFEPVYARVANAKAFHDSYPDRVGDVVTMVIVTPPMFQAQLQEFVDWKTERGFHVIVAVTGSPEVGTTTTSIQAYIHDLYNSPPPGLSAPSFVLFVGDVAEMPTFTVSGDATDRPYCAVDGDLVPDIYYGRFSATNSTELQAILDKTLMYDRFTLPDPSYLGEVVMIAGMDASHGSTWGNGQINYGTDNYFNAAHGISSHTYLYPASGSNSANIVQNVSDGVAYINYTAHGSQTSWSDPSFTQSDINGLGNAGRYCLAVGNCCLTSTYDYAECFAETWLRAADKGAIGYIGASNSTYWDEDYWWGVGSTATITADPTYAASGLGAYDGLFHDHGEAEHLWYVTNDAIVFCGNLAVMEAGGSTTYYWNIYNLMGDPSLSTYLGVPAVNAVSTSDLSPASITVQAVPGSYVGLSQDGVLLGAGTVDGGGSVTIDFLAPPDAGLPLHLVVTAQNHEPYVTDIDLATPVCSLSAAAVTKSMGSDEQDTELLEITNTGEPGSRLIYAVAVQGDPPPAKQTKSIAGSALTCAVAEYLPGATAGLSFTVSNASTDYEWLTDVTIDFPAGATVNSSTSFVGGSGGPLTSDGATGDGAVVAWQGDTGSPNYWGVVHGGESAVATINVTFAADASGDLDLDFTIVGDQYGANPHSLSGTIVLGEAGPSLTLTAPSGGEVWAIADNATITWNYDGMLADVAIDLSRNGGADWEPIAAKTPNDGSHDWIVTGPSSADCLVRVSSLDGGTTDTSDGSFAIYQPIAWLTVTPAAGDLEQGQSDMLELTFDTGGMTTGDYTAYVIITHTGQSSPEVVPITLQVDDLSGVAVAPDLFRLTGNHPNPFNPATIVSFSLPSAGSARLDVLDLRGYLVRTLWQGELPAGQHQVRWDGLDAAGEPVASGQYIARLMAASRRTTHKMILAR